MDEKREMGTEGLFYSGERENSGKNAGKRRCMGCMELCEKEERYCPHCGYDRNAQVEQPLHMLPGTILKGKYQIGKVLGYGGFGVTYIGWDMLLERRIAVKEYLPSEFATRGYGQTQVTVFSGDKADQFADGRRKFVEEAKRLAKFHSESGIVKIYDSFEENETAYIVMEYLDGETLAEFIEREKRIPAEKAVEMMMPVIESLNVVHEAGIIHRDIAPDNIILTKNGEVKLIDFGAARYATTTHSRSLTVIIKPGYSAEEQYRSNGEQGTHTDVYSVGAVLYKLITGETPPDALQRRAQFENSGKDILKPIKKTVKDVPKNIETAIYNAMNVRIEDRTPDMVNLAGELLSKEPVKRKNGKIKKIDVLSWPLWAKIGVPTGTGIALVLCILLALGIIGPRSRLNWGVEIPDGMTLIPDVVAYDLSEAEEELSKNELSLLIGEKREDEKIKENLVLLQDPDAGNVTAIGTFIKVTISAGAPKEYVIDVKGYTLELAKKELEALGFAIETKEEYNSEVAPGAVISQSVQAGEALAKGSVITLVISKGAENVDTSKEVTIPNVTGMDLEKAKAELKKYQLYIAIGETIYSDTIPEGQIIGQMPIEGTKGHAGDTVKVSVSMGSKKVYMPDVVYRTETEAVEILKGYGLSVKIVREENKDVAAGTVFKQSIAKGTEITAETTVTLTVSKGFTVTVPNVVGEEKTKAQKDLMGAGLASTVTYQNSSTVAKDHVISQSVKGGSKVNQGTTVNLVISAGQEELPPVEIIFTGINVESKPTKTLYYIGDSFVKDGLKVTANYSNGNKKDVTGSCKLEGFSSESAGTKTVTVTYEEDGDKRTATFAVTVKAPTVTLNRTSLTISDNSTGTIAAETVPGGQNVTWKSSNAAVATVSGGVVKGVKSGVTEITGSISYNGRTYTSQSCTVTVLSTEIPVTGVSLNQTSKTLDVGDTFRLTATVLPTNATNPNVTWITSNSSVATVSGGLVTAKSGGTATITAKTANGKQAQCKVTVNGDVNLELSQYNVTLNPNDSFVLLSYTNPKNVNVNIKTASGTENCIKIQGKTNSTDQNVNSAWMIQAVGIGSETLIVTAAYNGKTFTQKCIVTVAGNGGKCGDNAYWSLDNNGLLTITGNGNMEEYNSYGTPWNDYKDTIKHVKISNGINNVSNFSFVDCSNLESVTFAESIKTIGQSAFLRCNSLETLTIPKNVSVIKDFAFCECTKLKSINVDPNNKNYSSIGGVLFSKDQRTLIAYPSGKSSQYEIPSQVVNIGANAFYNCTTIKQIVLPDSVTTIEDKAFMGCYYLTGIEIPNGVKSIGAYAFSGCFALKDISLPDTLTHIGERAFFGCMNINSITIPYSVTNMGSSVFFGWTSSKTIYIEGRASAPSGWSSSWNLLCNAKIVWDA